MDDQKLEPLPAALKIRGRLRPITSYYTGRYECKTLVEPFVTDIPSGAFMASQGPELAYLPTLWSAQVHPEGQLYFSRQGPLSVVTEAYMYRTETMESICQWIEHIEAILQRTEMNIPKQIELFLKLEDEDCAYYLVDHLTQSQFWLERSDTESLGLPPVVSTSHLKIVLEELYWLHVEHFPMHLTALPPRRLDDLISIFSHGLCGQFIQTLENDGEGPKAHVELQSLHFSFRRVQRLYAPRSRASEMLKFRNIDRIDDGHSIWIIARLWSLIDHNKYITHYGQECSRLSRDQSILFEPEHKHPWISETMGFATFKDSQKHLARLDDVFVDHIVYLDQWERLLNDSLQQWRVLGYGAFAGLMLHLPFLVMDPPSPALVTTSITLFGSGLSSSIFLAYKYEPLQGMSANEAMNYLETIHSPVFGFQFVALVFSLPKTLALWGFLVVVANFLLLVAEHLSVGAAITLTGTSMGLILVLHCTTSDGMNSWNEYMDIFRRKIREGPIHMV